MIFKWVFGVVTVNLWAWRWRTPVSLLIWYVLSAF